jgi:hypothetical protein
VSRKPAPVQYVPPPNVTSFSANKPTTQECQQAFGGYNYLTATKTAIANKKESED